jgi:hypothetical protein
MIWKYIPDHTEYSVSDNGLVYSHKSGKPDGARWIRSTCNGQQKKTAFLL